MPSRSPSSLVAAVVLGAVLTVASCGRNLDTLGPAEYPSDAAVFDDGFAQGVFFEAFGGSKLDALGVDQSTHHSGATSLIVTVPGPGDPSGGYAGGAFISGIGRDLSGYNALTFWARSSMPATLNTAGIGNDNTGTSRFVAEAVGGLALTPSWKKYVIPIPDAGKLTQERGLFHFAEGFENNTGYEIWFDDARFESVETIQNPRPLIPTGTRSVVVGQTVKINGGSVTYSVNGADLTMAAAPDFFTYQSSDPAVAAVAGNGQITVVGPGTATITAKLAGVAAAGSLVLTAVGLPGVAAPTPTQPASDVISLFSNAYPRRTSPISRSRVTTSSCTPTSGMPASSSPPSRSTPR